MFSSTTEAVTLLSYGSDQPTVFELTDDLLDRADLPLHALDDGPALTTPGPLGLMLQRGLTAINDTRGTL